MGPFFNQYIICSTFTTLPVREPVFGDCVRFSVSGFCKNCTRSEHVAFLKILFNPQLFAFFNYQSAKSQQDLTVSMTAVSSHFLWHNIHHHRIPGSFSLPLNVPLAFNIRACPFFLISLVLLFSSVQGMCCITQW